MVYVAQCRVPASPLYALCLRNFAPRRRRAPRTPSEVLNRLQVSDLRPVLHLPLVEAARQLGLHRTSFMTRCRQLGIARWPAKQLRMLDLMEEQLQELEACGVANHYTAKVGSV